MNVILAVPLNVPKITCDICKMEFVLMAIYGDEDNSPDWMKQEAVSYCPYCGQLQNQIPKSPVAI